MSHCTHSGGEHTQCLCFSHKTTWVKLLYWEFRTQSWRAALCCAHTSSARPSPSAARGGQPVLPSATGQRATLGDDWTLFFCPQLTLWINDKLLTSQDVSYDEARNLHNKWLKHQAFMAELASHQGWLDSIDAVSKESGGAAPQICSPKWSFLQAQAPS